MLCNRERWNITLHILVVSTRWDPYCWNRFRLHYDIRGKGNFRHKRDSH